MNPTQASGSVNRQRHGRLGLNNCARSHWPEETVPALMLVLFTSPPAGVVFRPVLISTRVLKLPKWPPRWSSIELALASWLKRGPRGVDAANDLTAEDRSDLTWAAAADSRRISRPSH